MATVMVSNYIFFFFFFGNEGAYDFPPFVSNSLSPKEGLVSAGEALFVEACMETTTGMNSENEEYFIKTSSSKTLIISAEFHT